MNLFKGLLKYPAVIVTLAVALAGGTVALLGYGEVAHWGISLFCAAMAIKLAVGMLETLREGNFGIDILAVVAILSTIAVGEYWASIVIVLMLTGGESLEDYAAGRAKRELSALMERAPRIAHRKKGKSIEDVPIADVLVGDELLVKPGEIIPVDGVLLDKVAVFDESSITGESLPVEHQKGDELLSGVVNGDQAISMKVSRTAEHSQYQQIVQLVEAAASIQSPFVRLADRYSVPFTLVSFVIAGIAWALSGSPLRFAEVLVVATPCPLLIGAPVAIISGMSRAAKHGIIIKNGATLEKLARVATVAFDKTGTLTYGEPDVRHFALEKGVKEYDLLHLAASAEQQSTHVLAEALVAEAKRRKIDIAQPQKIKETTAQGIAATVDGKKVLVGKLAFLGDNGVTAKVVESSESNETVAHVAVDGKYMGAIFFSDQVRENSRKTLDELYQLGVGHTLMLSGDAKPTAYRIAKELGITDVRAECLPQDKVDAVAKLNDRPVLMVGDGVNDAPVLAAAEVGMAMGARGSTIASEAADVVVMLDDISRVSFAVRIAKHTVSIALQSVWIGIIISIGLMLLATTGRIPAVVGAGLQEVIDVIVIFNALRAHGSWRRPVHVELAHESLARGRQ